MWSALRSDLEEFVTTVKDESSTVLATSANVSEDDTTNVGRDAVQQEEEGGGRGIVMGEDGEVIYDDSDDGVMMDEIDRLVREEETFTEPLDTQDEEVIKFLTDFDVEKQTDDIAKLLEEYPDTLQVQFESLVPTQISYKEFWERYYFRCDEDRIQREWELQQEAARRAREEAIANTVRGVKNLFGGAVKAVSSTLQAANDGVDAVTASPFETTPPPTGASQGLFGAPGRPPFVMNTAVDEDDDEEEEELGWDDDDEEDFDDEENEEEELIEGESEEITFSGGKDEEMEKLAEQLAQAVEERDQLHSTVEMQSQEIARLKSGDTSGTLNVADDNAAIVEKLKMELFEKDSELAALKASLEDTQDDSKESVSKKDAAKLASQERELEQLRSAVVAKETEISGLKQELQTSSAELEKLLAERDAESAKDAEIAQLRDKLENSTAEVERLLAQCDSEKAARTTAMNQGKEMETEVKTLREQLTASQSEADMLRQTVETVSSGTESQVSSALEEAAASKAQVDSLTAQVEDLKGNLQFTTGRADHLERELQEARDALKKQEAAAATKLAEEIAKVNAEHEQLSSGTPNSESTGVKVAAPKEEPAPATVTKIESSNEDDDDDWGDDWGDEDE